ncbi:MAG: glycosyltransferase [Bacteroidales bacterium]
MNMPMQFSVLIPVYFKDQAVHFAQALDSIAKQTLLPNEIVIVKDGPINAENEAVLTHFASISPVPLIITALPTNQGISAALNQGICVCSYAYIARMDADDIAKPLRFEKQIAFLETHPEVDILGSNVDEFLGEPTHIISQRRVPSSHADICKAMKIRCPFNHPSLIYKKEAILKVGGYIHFYNLEDWHLWARLFLNGAQMANIPESLLLFRATAQMFKRRGGIKYTASDIKLQWFFYKIGLTNFWEMARNLIVRIPVRLAPASVREFFYKHILRSLN